MRITVVGGGNIGTQFAVHSAAKGHSVRMFTSSPDHFAKHLLETDKQGNVTCEGDIEFATNDAHRAFCDADMIMITMPPTMMIPLAELILEHADERAMIGFVPGNGGFEFAFRDCLERGNVIFGIDRVPAIARLTERGRAVCCSGFKEKLFVAALPSAHTESCAALIESIYDIPCVRLPGFMALTLTPSNPILHTSRLMTIFRDYEPGVTYDSLPLFYEEWDDASSELLMACDDEIQAICRALPGMGLEHVVSEREFYGADTAADMTRAICTEESLLGLTTPSVHADTFEDAGRGYSGVKSERKDKHARIQKHIQRRMEWRARIAARIEARRQEKPDRQGRQSGQEKAKENAGLIPDLHSRYFTADFPYGLTVIQQIGHLAGVPIPAIDGLIDWYDRIALVNDKLYLSDYGIDSLDDLKEFYSR